MRRLAIGSTVLAVLAAVACLVFGLFAIWGGDDRWASTAVAMAFTAMAAGLAAAFLWLEVER